MSARLLLSIVCGAILCGCHPDLAAVKKECTPVDRIPAIKPDYSGIVIPPNIAPLNFIVAEPGIGYCAEISSKLGKTITVVSNGPSLRIPVKQWEKLLERNRGEPLRTNLYVRDKTGQWLSYKAIEDTIAAEPIDRYVTYRILTYWSQFNFSADLRIYQRDLGSFNSFQLISTTNFAWGCCSCHVPFNNEPGRFIVQLRTMNYGNGTLIADKGKISKIAARLGYADWHPSGRLIAAPGYNVYQCFHMKSDKDLMEQYDTKSDISIYSIEKEKIITVEQLSRGQTLENWPNWSPDGRYLYFCSAPILWTDFNKMPPDNYEKVKYSLVRIAYNIADDTWGDVETVLSSQQTGLSITQPRISHDGQFLLFCMHQYGGYPHTHRSSDLYMMNIATKKYWRLDVSSNYADSWHCWSSNDRWILFSSKRNSGIFTRVYFSYVDSSGTVHKAFVMPQKDPAFYDSYIKCYNVPEFETGPVPFSEREILKVIRSPVKVNVPLPPASAAPTGHAAWEKTNTR